MTDYIPPHGTASRYQGPRRHNRWQPCRCEPCRVAWRRGCKIRDLRQLHGESNYVELKVVVDHINKLMDSGWNRTAIYKAAEVSRRAMWSWLNGTVDGVQYDVARRVLALRPVPRTPDLVPALGTARRLQALAAMGWPLSRSGVEAGISDTHAGNLARGRHAHVTVEVARKVEAYYRLHCMRPGPSAFAKTVAQRNGWVTAAAWDDIDDPNCMPDLGDEDPVNRTAIAAHRLAEITFLVECNVSEHEIAERLGMRPQYVHDVIRDKVRPLRQAALGEAA